MFAVLAVVFALTWAATRAGYARKLSRGLAESRQGRTAAQVMANVGLAAWAVVIPLWWMGFAPLAACAAVAVLAEAAADTCASELGKAYGGKTVLFTTWGAVPAGTDGGVSWVGMASAVAPSLLIAGTAEALGLLTARSAAWVALAGVFGAVLDSVLGGTLERRGWLNNDGVNLLGTAAAGAVAAMLCLV